MLGPRALLSAAVGYVRKNPDEVVKAAVNAATLRFGVPIAALRFLAAQATGRKATMFMTPPRSEGFRARGR